MKEESRSVSATKNKSTTDRSIISSFMTEKHLRTAEFEATVGKDGSLSIPGPLLESLGLEEGVKVSVRITGKRATTLLKRGSVTNDEIDRIAGMQLEPTDQVVKFLLSEGALKTRRHKGLREGGKD